MRDKWVDEQSNLLIENQSVLQIIKVTEILRIGYNDLLKSFDWQLKRLRILVRDSFICQDCKMENSHLHVHHLYYLKNHLPWDIEEAALIALCHKYHKNRHDKEKIAVYEKVGDRLIHTTNYNIYCSRCNGAGYFPEFSLYMMEYVLNVMEIV